MKRTFFNSKGKDKQYIVIGCGRFGSSVAKKMCQLGNEVMVIDKDEDFVCIIKLMNDNVFGEEVLGNAGKETGEELMI